ncbi:phage late control gene d protein (gpd) [Lucifera butyrica]|uniref:Phage late control gene d protein (Gpd) n=1 Tax=Lucifera butyrica TaxID=1351585 RepID=A0A498R4T3_9FIRM|nr:contractile injection system protein, VgrG/Pvc8 family [Lucifera butyrica]VBB06149.1 phage late control gene d protein (gpd) [Lucifera butyrica]
MELSRITALEIVHSLNEHGKIYIKGIAPDTLEAKEIEQVADKAKIEIHLPGQPQPFFAGVCIRIELCYQAGLKIVEIEGRSWTYELDIAKKSRSYQQLGISYQELLNEVLKDYPAKAFLITLPDSKKYDRFAVQYWETDWDFLRRIAAREGTVLVPEYCDSSHRPRFWLGLPNLSAKSLTQTAEQASRSELGNYLKVALNADDSVKEKDFITYQAKGHEILRLGDLVDYGGKKLTVVHIVSKVDKGVLTSAYMLAGSEKMALANPENRNIQGVSLPGKVLDSRGINSQVHLDIDARQEKSAALWFPYASDLGNFLYCMPHNGESVNLYFKDGYEANAILVTNARKNGGQCPKTADYNNRYFTNYERKELFLSPDTVSFTVDESAAEKIAIKLNDADGITIESTKPIVFGAKQGLRLEAAKNIDIEGMLGVYGFSGPASIILKDNKTNFYGGNVLVDGANKSPCPPVEQPAEPKKKSILGKIASVGEAAWETFKKEPLIDKVQTVLDIASCCPVIGSAASVVNGAISIGRGNYGEAALNFACAVPGAAWAKAGAKLAEGVKLGATAAKEASVVAKTAINAAEDAARIAARGAKIAKTAAEEAGRVVLGKGKTMALKALEKIPKPKIVWEESLVLCADGMGHGTPFRFPRLLIEAGEGSGKAAENMAKKYAKEIEQSRAAYKRAAEVGEQYEEKFGTKTFASNGKKTMSGWDGKTTIAPTECTRVEPREVMDYSEEIGHKLKNSGSNDHGIPGQFQACHAEKQLSLLTDSPIGVNRKMCTDCQGYFQKHAAYTGEEKFVTDPEMTRIFHPNGEVSKILW